MAREALTNGAERASYLKLAGAEEQAVVQVLLRSTSGLREYCSGVVVAAGVVLTAKHCLHEATGVQATVVFSPTEGDHGSEVAATVAGVHSDLDLMVLALDDGTTPLEPVVPLSIGARTPTSLQPGRLVQTAGYGFGANGSHGVRAFLVETLRRVDEHELAVDAASLGGACYGDSGGPLLARDDQGVARVFGILAFGSSDCFGRDHYTRVGGEVAAWIHEVTGVDADAPTMPTRVGDTLGAEGRCFDDQAVWSEAGSVRSEICASPKVCGWSDEAGGFRCLDAERDPCRGVSDVGGCWDRTAVRCVQGRLEQNPCSECGFSCARSPRTGTPICLSTAH